MLIKTLGCLSVAARESEADFCTKIQPMSASGGNAGTKLVETNRQLTRHAWHKCGFANHRTPTGKGGWARGRIGVTASKYKGVIGRMG